MTLIRRSVGIAAVLALLGTQVAAEEKPETVAIPVARSWLKLVDGGKYDESWAQSAALFKGALLRTTL